MSDKALFQRLKIGCKPALKLSDPARFIIVDQGNSNLVVCYMKAAMLVGEERNHRVRYNTKYKYELINGSYQTFTHGTVYLNTIGLTIVQLEAMVEFIHIHAEILYEMTDESNIWRMMYDRNVPRETYP